MQPLSEQLRTRTRDEVLEFAYRRGDRLRRQRLVVRSAAAAVVFAAAVPAALVVFDTADDKRQDVQVVDMPTTTTIPPDNESPAEPENGALGPVPASGAAAASQAAAPARSVVKPPVGDASKPAPRSQVEECGTSEVSLSTSTDKPSYLPTETVVITARIKNTSNHPCLPVTSGEVLVDDAGGVRRFTDQEPVADVPTWQAGQTIQLVFRWTPCPQQPCQFSQGAHTVRVAWHGAGNYARGTTTFTIGV